MTLRAAAAMRPLVILLFLVISTRLTGDERPLTNEDVAQIVQLGLGDQVVMAKIKQAHQVNFRLDTEALGSLKKAGVSAAVIQAMLERTSRPPSPTPPAAPGPTLDPSLGGMLAEKISVRLVTSEGEHLLRLSKGQMSTTGFGWAFTYMDYPGLSARVRTTDPGLHLLVRADGQIEGGRYFLAKLDRDEDDVCRSLKIGSVKQRFSFKSKKAMQPDKDWVVPYDVSEAEPGIWRIQPRRRLEAGEYGFYIDPQLLTMYFHFDTQSGGIFDFGVDGK